MSAQVFDISGNRKYRYHPTPEDYARQTQPLPPIPTLASPLSRSGEHVQWFCWGVMAGFLIAGLVVIFSRSHGG